MRDRLLRATDVQISNLGLTIESCIEKKVTKMTSHLIWCPHKMELVGTTMQSKADGANGQTDVAVVVRVGDEHKPMVVCMVYHTTNAVDHTYSGREVVVLPEGR